MRSSSYLPALRAERQKAATRGERAIGALFPNRGIGWSADWSGNRAEQVSHYRNWTFVAVDAIASKVASVGMPNMAYVVDSPSRRAVKACNRMPGAFGQDVYVSDGGHGFLTVGAYRRKALSVIKPHEMLEPLEADHPLRRLIDNPNRYDTTFNLMYELQMFEELCGVSYLWTPLNQFGMPCEMWVMPSHWVWPRTGGGTYVDPNNPHADELIQFYEIRPWGTQGSAGYLRIPPNEIIMNLWKSPIDKIGGYSKLAAIAQWIDSEESISKSRWAQFQNQARPELWVELGPGYEDPDDLMISRIEAKIAAKLQGEYNYGKPIITPPGAKLTPLSFNPTEMAYFQCLDEETECLTKDGWKKYTELTLETEVACYDPDTNRTVYHKPSRINVQDYAGDMYQWDGEKVNSLMTPNHRCYVERPTTVSTGGTLALAKTPYRNSSRLQLVRKGRKNKNLMVWDVKRADELAPRTGYGVLTAAPAVGEDPEFIEVDNFDGWRQRDDRGTHRIPAEDWARFLGHFISEGCNTGREGSTDWSVSLCQSDVGKGPNRQAKFNSVRDGVAALPYHWKAHRTASGVTHWSVWDKGLFQHLTEHCGTDSFTRKIPVYVKGWSSRLLKVLLTALVEGDGTDLKFCKGGRISSRTTKDWSAQYSTSSRQLADDVMEIAAKCGYRAMISTSVDRRPEHAGTERFTVNISTAPRVTIGSEHRRTVSYRGKVWCVTVPTGLFIVRRGGKALVTGNSEEQIRDMILSTFRVPPSAVGIVKEMTYGSILATLAAFCAYCLNPRLTSRGQMMTKRLASRWDRPGRRVRLWYDDCVPADPQQVNSDIDTDARNYAITPNEVRALRGRRPYRVGGSDPIVSGPGGPMPLPLNTGDSLEDFAKLVEPMASVGQQGGGEEGGMPAPGGEEGGDQEGADGGGQDQDPLAQALGQVQAEEPDETDLAEDTAAPEEPNGKPSKSYRGWVEKKLGPFSYASTQLDLKQDDTPDNTGRYAWEHVRRMAEAVADGDLAEDGRETDPHLTILYGLEDENPDAVHRLVHDFGPVTFTLGKTIVFRTEGADVVVIEATGDGLKALRQRVAALRHTDNYPEYKPHVTVAYVKPGEGAKYAGRADVDGLEVTVNTLTFSDKDGNKTYLHMAGYGHGGQVVRGAGATVTKKVPGPTFRGAGAPSPRATVKDKTTGTCKPGETAARSGGDKQGKRPAEGGTPSPRKRKKGRGKK